MEEDNIQIPEMEYDEFNAPIPGQSLTDETEDMLGRIHQDMLRWMRLLMS